MAAKEKIFISREKRALFACLIIAVLGAAVYLNSLGGEFIWDDTYLIRDNIYIKNLSYLPNIFISDIAAGAGSKADFYRPLQILSYAADHFIWGMDVRGYHISNIALHILTALCVFWLVRILYDDWPVALLAASLFVIHPIHTEAVAYISGRSDILAGALMLLCLVCYIKHSNSQSAVWYIAALLTYFLALLSRESSLIMPAILLLYHYSFKKKIRARYFAPIVGLAGLFVLLRMSVLGSMLSSKDCSVAFIKRLPGTFAGLTDYLRLLFLPLDLHMEYGVRLFSWTSPKVVMGIIVFLAALAYVFKKKNNDTLISFSLLWFFVMLSPFSNIFPLNAYMAEHWLYLPSIGFFVIFARLLVRGCRKKRYQAVAAAGIVGIIAFYSYLTVRQNMVWKDPLTFYEYTMKHAPDNAKVYNSLGILKYDKGDYQEAAALYKKAIEKDPYLVFAYSNLGNAYNALGKKTYAISAYKKALAIEPNAMTHFNLGTVYSSSGLEESAIASFLNALEMNPYYADAYNNLAMSYYAAGRHQDAIGAYRKTVEIEPGSSYAYSGLGDAYNAISERDKAIEAYRNAIEADQGNENAYFSLWALCSDQSQKDKAIKLFAQDIRKLAGSSAAAYVFLGNTYKDIGMARDAIACFELAIDLDRSFVKSYQSLGILYFQEGAVNEAIGLFNRAIEINPGFSPAYYNLSVVYFKRGQYGSAIEYCDKAKELGFVNQELVDALEQYRKKF